MRKETKNINTKVRDLAKLALAVISSGIVILGIHDVIGHTATEQTMQTEKAKTHSHIPWDKAYKPAVIEARVYEKKAESSKGEIEAAADYCIAAKKFKMISEAAARAGMFDEAKKADRKIIEDATKSLSITGAYEGRSTTEFLKFKRSGKSVIPVIISAYRNYTTIDALALWVGDNKLEKGVENEISTYSLFTTVALREQNSAAQRKPASINTRGTAKTRNRI